ncbi:hypothetical protein [Streptomyces sp. NPDC090093]|uniref:hypothetical protein n=1 Tax=Streptomyces sp. NPDC090093 TaxID=3365945 RepID=UPI00382F1F1D
MESVSWSRGTRAHQAELKVFTCCPGCRTQDARHPTDPLGCRTEWAHTVQTYFQEEAVEAAQEGALDYDQRLLLLRDADDLVGAAAHYSDSDPDDPPGGPFIRRLAAYAIASHAQGGKLSTGEYASKALLRAVVSDITSRYSPQDEVLITGLVLPMNKASRTCLERHGWVIFDQQGRYLVYANSLKSAQKALGVDASLGVDAFHAPGT